MSDTSNLWNDFIRSIYKDNISCSSASQGRLLVMGTGIKCADFLTDVEEELYKADIVLYCVADPITEAVIHSFRNDAIDLSILYSSGKPRYQTYVQMAEAMVAPVRRGKRVLSLFYGHPGVFAMPTHRAIAIARSEGLKASMRPGISALDYLVADVGFDPAYPGLLTYEATDLLLRKRRLDPTLHTVLWQVGVVGEMGFDRAGFRNDGFIHLVNTLESVYGDADVVHYIGSRFPGVPPAIENLSIKSLRSENVRKTISALSTFYIPPVVSGTTDRRVASAFGIEDVDTSTGGAPPVYNVARYGPHEREAVDVLKNFTIPRDYRHITSTPAVCLMIDLFRDQSLRDQFDRDPSSVLQLPRYADMSDRAKSLLQSGDVRDAHIAMYERAKTSIGDVRLDHVRK